MTVRNITTIGLIGSGHIGSQLARLAVQHGYRAVLSNSRGPDTLHGPRRRDRRAARRAGTAEDAARRATSSS